MLKSDLLEDGNYVVLEDGKIVEKELKSDLLEDENFSIH